MTNDRFWSQAAKLALDVPAKGAEQQAWRTRNLCELALAIEIGNGPQMLLDNTVRQTSLELAPQRLAKRLFGLRARWGSVPPWYPQGIPDYIAPTVLTAQDRDAVTRLLTFASYLESSSVESTLLSALDGRGAASIELRASWRPFPTPHQPPHFEELDIPQELMWRAWLMLPSVGPTRVVNDEQLTTDDFDIWWGVHDGSHLDHLAIFPSNLPAPIEYGEGLLLAESLVMSLELLAAAEALVTANSRVQSRVRVGILERVGRLTGVFTDSDLIQAALRMGVERDVEFAALQTLARAYVTGPFALIARQFNDPLIPDTVANELISRWRKIGKSHPIVSETLGARF